MLAEMAVLVALQKSATGPERAPGPVADNALDDKMEFMTAQRTWSCPEVSEIHICLDISKRIKYQLWIESIIIRNRASLKLSATGPQKLK